MKMVKVREDMTGWVMSEHGVPNSRLTVIEQVDDYISPNGTHESMWRCNCACGKDDVIVRGRHIKHGNILSCGCYNRELTIKRNKAGHFNKYDLTGEYGIGWTSNTNREFYFDLKYYDKIKDICWCERKNKNPTGTNYLIGYDAQNKKNVNFHVFIGYRGYDHIDRNEFNNLESNLRKCTVQENNCNKSISIKNTSGVIGVSWHKMSQKWMAGLKVNNKSIYLGIYTNKDDAIRARLNAEVKYFGEFAPQKHLYEQYGITEQND